MNVIVLTQHAESQDDNPITAVEGVFSTPELAIAETNKLFNKLKKQFVDNLYEDELSDIEECPISDDAVININNPGSILSASIYLPSHGDYIELTLTVCEIE